MIYFISGGAGFIGSHMARSLLELDKSFSIIIYDNFSSLLLKPLKIVNNINYYEK
jgi:UDP-glucose 4-epimerase